MAVAYEVKSISNGDKLNNGDGTWTLPLTVISGIVGDRPLSSNKAFTRGDETSVIVNATDTGAKMDAKAIAQASAFVAEKYPNT